MAVPSAKRQRNTTGSATDSVQLGDTAATYSQRNENLAPANSLYATLGVGICATPAQIRRGFEEMASHVHPAGSERANIEEYSYLAKARDILLDKKKRARYDRFGKKGLEGDLADPGKRILYAPVSDLLEKLAQDEAWACQRWKRGAGGYRFDVLAAILLRRVSATGRVSKNGARETKDKYRLGRGAIALGICNSRLVSGHPARGDSETSSQASCDHEDFMRETDYDVPASFVGLAAASMKSAFRAVVLFGCVEFDLVASWLFCANELARVLELQYPPLDVIAVNGLADGGEPRHTAERLRLANDAGVSDKVIKGVIQRMIGGGRAPAANFLFENNGYYTEELGAIEESLSDLCSRVFKLATPDQIETLSCKADPARSFFAHKLMELERQKIDHMERVAGEQGAPACGLLGDATVHPPGTLNALRRAQVQLAESGIITSLKPLAEGNLVQFLHKKGIMVGQPSPSRAMPVCGLRWADAWLKCHKHVYSDSGWAPHSSYATIAASRWDARIRKTAEDSWATLNESNNIWEITREPHCLGGETTSRFLQEELQGHYFDDDGDVGYDGKIKITSKIKPFSNNLLEEDRFLNHVASQIKKKEWPHMVAHEKAKRITAFANGLSVDWEEPDPFLAVVPTLKEWGLTRYSDAHLVSFVDALVSDGKTPSEAIAIASSWIEFTDLLIKEKIDALASRREIDLEQFKPKLEAILDDFPCIKHIFWEPLMNVRDMFCALQIRADAFSGRSQKAHRVTAFGEFGVASSNKGGRRELDERTFGTHVPPQKMGYVFKMSSIEMCAKTQRGPWEAAANAEGSRLGYSDEWTSSTRMNNATFKAFHAGNSIDFDRKHQSKREVSDPPPLIYISNEGIRFQDPVIDGEERRLQIMTCKRRIVAAEDYDSDDETHIKKNPRIKSESKKWSPEYVFVLICVARGCDIVQDDVPFPAPNRSRESVAEMLDKAGPATTVDNMKIAVEFLDQRLERCPAGYDPTSRLEIIRDLCEFAANAPWHSRSSRDILQRCLEQLVENAGDVSVSIPAKRTYRPYLLKTKERRTLRMIRLKPRGCIGGGGGGGGGEE